MSSSTSDSDDIEIDGFPPEHASKSHFQSMKSTNDSLTNQKIYLPINSWNADVIPANIIMTCIQVLKDTSSLADSEKHKIMEQLENELNLSFDSLKMDKIWNSKFHSISKPSIISNASVIKVNVEIPSMNANSSNIRYSVDRPSYNSEKQSWNTSLEFVLNNENEVKPIFETGNEISQDHKETQTESNANLFSSITKPISLDLRSKSEQQLAGPDRNNFDEFEKHLTEDVDITVIEKLEKSFSTKKISQTNIKSSFSNFKVIVKSNIEKLFREIKKLKIENESLLNHSYDKLTESQHKKIAKNQVLLMETERELNNINKELNRKSEAIRKQGMVSEKAEIMEIEKEMKKIKFSNSLRLILQMVSNIKNQTMELTKDVNGKNILTFFSKNPFP